MSIFTINSPRIAAYTFLAAAVIAGAAVAGDEPPSAPANPPTLTTTPPTLVRGAGDFKQYWQDIPSAAFKFAMMPVPGSADGAIKPLYVAKTELTWEAFDVWAYRLDEKGEQTPSPQQSSLPAGAPDAATRPSKPYHPPDRGFGHEGYAAISLTFRSAETFCKWLSTTSGLKYRLPTEAEWEHACLAGQSGDFGFEGGEAELPRFAWLAANSDEKPHPAATKKANAWGLYDMHGNVQEWVTGRDGKPTTKGGSWRDPPEMLKASVSQAKDSTWNASDPNLPKSKWWLSDGNFVGFRVVCEVGEDGKPARADGAAKPAERPDQK